MINTFAWFSESTDIMAFLMIREAHRVVECIQLI